MCTCGLTYNYRSSQLIQFYSCVVSLAPWFLEGLGLTKIEDHVNMHCQPKQECWQGHFFPQVMERKRIVLQTTVSSVQRARERQNGTFHHSSRQAPLYKWPPYSLHKGSKLYCVSLCFELYATSRVFYTGFALKMPHNCHVMSWSRL